MLLIGFGGLFAELDVVALEEPRVEQVPEVDRKGDAGADHHDLVPLVSC